MAAVTRLLSGSRCLLARSRSGISAVLRTAGGCPGAGAARLFSSDEKIKVKFVNRDGDAIIAEGKVGESLLDLVVEKNLDIDGFGACEGTLACSTCHLIFEDHIFQQLEPITDEEMDMLDLAYGLTDTSRLGCQICLRPFMDGMTVRVPESVADVRQAVDMGKNS
ncbi:adrenodoxin, mitochondrial [Dendropsophus ebraccatus]|uniref:adrenodoxin, mitochondrial n=1 Tax=Dendropsophus ebraccatus TaxID=150705 RepID=UPI0038319377